MSYIFKKFVYTDKNLGIIFFIDLREFMSRLILGCLPFNSAFKRRISLKSTKKNLFKYFTLI